MAVAAPLKVSHVSFYECHQCLVTKEKNDCYWPYCSAWCMDEASDEQEQKMESKWVYCLCSSCGEEIEMHADMPPENNYCSLECATGWIQGFDHRSAPTSAVGAAAPPTGAPESSNPPWLSGPFGEYECVPAGEEVYYQAGEAEPEDENSENPPLECEYCCFGFYPTDGAGLERFCSNECAARGAGMNKDPVTGVETLREHEKKPADFGAGKIYQERIYNNEDPYDVAFWSKVIVQQDGTLKQLKGSVNLRKGSVFKSWEDWRAYCRPYLY